MPESLKQAANARAWALGDHMANAEKRPGEEIRRAVIQVGTPRKRRNAPKLNAEKLRR